jgi:hypothetical protein
VPPSDTVTADALPVAGDAQHRRVEVKRHAALRKQLPPRVDPHVAGRAVEQAVRAAAHAREVEQQLEQDVAAGAGADLARPGGHQRAGQAVAEVLAKGRRAPVGLHERPPAHALPLLEAALVAARQQDEQLVGEEDLLVDGDAQLGAPGEQEAHHRLEVVERRGQPRGADHVPAPARLGEQDPARRDEVVQDALRVARVGDAPHRVGHVAVEAGEEAKAVLGRQFGTTAGARAGHRQAARLAARPVARLVDRDLEAPLGQLVRGRKAGDPAAKHCDDGRHPPTVPFRGASRVSGCVPLPCRPQRFPATSA